jgi:DNA-binding NarL/FixJ family response regulator
VTSPRPTEPEDRAFQSFARAIRGAQPQAGPAFLEQLDRWMRDELGRSAPASTAPSRPEAARRTIGVCVVEPDPFMRDAMIRMLESDPGIEVVGQADDGLEAMALVHAVQPDVVVLELRLGGLDGLALIRRLQREVPVVRSVIMTADKSSESLLDAVDGGAAGYLLKAASGEELRQAVTTVYEGGSVIMPELAGHLLRELPARLRASSVQALPHARELEIRGLLDGAISTTPGRARRSTPGRWALWSERSWAALRRWCTR